MALPRKKFVAGNFKMNMTSSEVAPYLEVFRLETEKVNDVDIVLIPPFTAIPKASEILGGAQKIRLGAQNMSPEAKGAYTGEISAAMLRDLFVRFVLVGHSERRRLFGETDETVRRKLEAALKSELRPILCIGETLEERQAGQEKAIPGAATRGGAQGTHSRRGLRGCGRLRTRLGDRDGPHRHARAGSGGPLLHPRPSRQTGRRCGDQEVPHPLRRQRHPRKRTGTHVPTGHRRGTGRRCQPRPTRLRGDRGRGGSGGINSVFSRRGAETLGVYEVKPPRRLFLHNSSFCLHPFGIMLRRLASLPVVLVCVVTITFFLIRLSPGGPFDSERKLPVAIEKQLLAKYKLDGPILTQYTGYLRDLLHGDLRLSTKYRNRSVNEILAQTLPVTITLGTSALLIAITAGIWLGAFAAARPGTLAEGGALAVMLLAISLPSFVLGPC